MVILDLLGHFWIDPKNDLIIVLLTNRVYPNRSYENLYDLDIEESSRFDNLISVLELILAKSLKISRYSQTRVTINPNAEYHSIYLKTYSQMLPQ